MAPDRISTFLHCDDAPGCELDSQRSPRYGTAMTIQYVDPRGVPAKPADPYELGVSLGPDTVVGLLANNFHDSIAFLDEVEAALHAQYPSIATKRYKKRNASDIASDDLLAKIRSECHGLITAYGH